MKRQHWTSNRDILPQNEQKQIERVYNSEIRFSTRLLRIIYTITTYCDKDMKTTFYNFNNM